MQRQEKILSSLEILKYASREQIQQIHELGSARNALKVLGQLKEFLQVHNHGGKNIYYLSKAGRELVGMEEELKWTQQADHHIMRNDMYIYMGMPESWKVEESITFKPQLSNREHVLVPDATFVRKGVYHFLEVDRTQSMVENKKKISQYQQLKPLMKVELNQTPVLLFYTLTDLRRKKLTELCSSMEVDCEIYTKEDTR